MWWEKRGGGSAEGATRPGRLASSPRQRPRADENSPGREPQGEPRARLQSRDLPQSAVSPQAPPRVLITPMNNPRLHAPECQRTGFRPSAGPPTRRRNTSQQAVRLPAGGTWGSGPARKWTGHPGQLGNERRRVPVFRGGVSSGWCRMEEKRPESATRSLL